MKKLLKISMCFILMLGMSEIRNVQAEETSVSTENEDVTARGASMNGQSRRPYQFATNKEDVVQDKEKYDSLRLFYLQFHLPDNKVIDIHDYTIKINTSDIEMFSKDSVDNFTFMDHLKSYSCFNNNISTTYLRPTKEGTVIIDVELTNKQIPTEKYYASSSLTFSDKHKGEKLVASKKEFNTKKNGLLIFNLLNGGYKEMIDSSVEEFEVGLQKEDGVFNFSSDIDIVTSDPSIAVAGFTDSEATIPDTMKDTFVDENMTSYFPNYINKFFTDDEYGDAYWSYASSKGQCTGGYGRTGDKYVYSIIPRNPGTAYVTFSYGSQSVTVKVNVSNLTDEPTEKLPSGLADEFNSDSNKNVNVNLSNPDTVNSDIFNASKETKKNVTFNILGENNKIVYAWSFNGSTITNSNMDLDLSLSFDTDKQSEIEVLAKDTNLFYLNFAHHGALPGISNMKVDVSSKYKNGEEIYLYYYNEKNEAAEQIGDKIIVKDGYAEFEIDHCSTYFFTPTPIENNENNQNSTSSNDTDANTTNDGNKISPKTTNISDNVATGVDSTSYVSLVLLMVGSIGALVILNKQKRN